ncbi:hypothetical protein TELCIR_20353 [Teladorsagia circumcincta]|uniref:Uncharacterized protein n=1 Tax=Teladorsagia circumcincta TaxID=45464 RepID=A0A2G9TJR4_TELCI|nr:hypothetical protein TELCIR_20353 [Teladorsagia circumcincta]
MDNVLYEHFTQSPGRLLHVLKPSKTAEVKGRRFRLVTDYEWYTGHH